MGFWILIYHIAESSDWIDHDQNDHYVPAKFAGEGFVHCASLGQLENVADRHFYGKNELFLIEIDPTCLEARTIYENLDGKKEKYPHIYGVIEKSAIKRVFPIACNNTGTFAGVFENIL